MPQEIKEKIGELKPCKICGKPTYFENHISCKIMKEKEILKEKIEDWEKEFDKMKIWERLDKIIDSEMGIGFEDRKNQYVDSDKKLKSFIRQLLSQEKQKAYNEGFDKAINLITFAVNKCRPKICPKK